MRRVNFVFFLLGVIIGGIIFGALGIRAATEHPTVFLEPGDSVLVVALEPDTPTPEPTATLEPTDTPLPTATNTPTLEPPTATPTPMSVLEVRVDNGNDDAEERVSNGRVSLTSSDLELIRDGSGDQAVGIRFQNVTIPQGVTITRAYIEFETDSTRSQATSLAFYGQAADTAPAFTGCSSGCYDVSSRSRTTAFVAWDNVPAWNSVNEKHQTPNLAPIVQEIVNRRGWSSGNNVVFIITGYGVRVAESYNGEANAAPLLRVEYTTATAAPTKLATPTQPPTATPTATQPSGHIYYVATDGDDNNPGTEEAQPFRTIVRGVSVLGSGDTLYVREGTYYEQVTVSASGKADSPITISAYPGEHPVIDAQDTLPGDYYGYLISLTGDHITFSGLEIKNVDGTAIGVTGSYDVIQDMKIHHCLNKAILIGGSSTNSIVEDNEVWMTSLIHEGVDEGGRWAGAISVARYPQDTIIRRNTVHETWGLGIQSYEAYNTVIEDNVVWNSQMAHYYVNNAPNTVVRRNLSYNTADSVFLYKGLPGAGIAFCDERPEPVSHHVTIINNLVMGSSRGFYFWNQQPGSGLKHFLIAHNTFVNNITAGIQINAGDHEASRIVNNIIVQDESVGPVAIVVSDPNLDFSYNLWPETPPADASGPGDVIGDPLLAKSGPIDPGLLDPGWFRLLSDSPAIDAGIMLSEAPDDFDGVSRPRGAGYDIGAYESFQAK